MRLFVRAMMIALVAVVVTACRDDEPNDSDMAVSDMAVCDVRTPPASPTPCGQQTCPAGQICFIEHPGICLPPDLAAPTMDGGEGGGPYTCVNYACVAPPGRL